MKKFNINHNVLFVLTEYGKKVWKNFFDEYPVENYPFEKHFNAYTKDGMTKMQMHSFMNIFSKEISMGNLCIKNMEIFFLEEELQNV